MSAAANPTAPALVQALALLLQSEQELPATTSALRARVAGSSQAAEIDDLIAAIMISRFSGRSIQELCAMGGITLEDFTESVAYREIFGRGEARGVALGEARGVALGQAQGEAKVTLRQLIRRCGPLSAEQESLIRSLPLQRLEALAEALLDFEGMADLAAWLAANAKISGGGLDEDGGSMPASFLMAYCQKVLPWPAAAFLRVALQPGIENLAFPPPEKPGRMRPSSSQIDQLQREIASGQLVVVVGSGVSVAACGNQEVDGHKVATWRGLLDHGVHRLSEIGAADGDEEMLRNMIRSGKTDFMISAAGMITDRLKGLSDGIFRGWLSDSIGQLKIQDRTLLQDIAALPGLVATLNYDHLLVEETGRPAITWQETNAVQDVLRGTREAILHLHGEYRKA
jgi:hypothetical protein